MRSGSSIQLLSKEFYMNITAKPTWQWKNNGAGNHIRDGRTSPHPSLLKQLLLPRSLDVSFALTELDNVTEAPILLHVVRDRSGRLKALLSIEVQHESLSI